MPFLPFRETNSVAYFVDRHEAGEKLAQVVLHEVKQQPEWQAMRVVVYALPKGGLPIAYPVAKLLGCPLDVIVAKKITRPDNVELAIGAVTADGHVVWDAHRRDAHATPYPESSPETSLSASDPYAVALREAQSHAQAQLAELSPGSPLFSPRGAIAILVDDGIATGMTMAAAVQAVRSQQPAQVWLCAPVAPLELMPLLHTYGDRVIVLATPHPFYSVSRFYKAFPQVTMTEAAAYLH
jgi:predicted phosphoribosyltransferase